MPRNEKTFIFICYNILYKSLKNNNEYVDLPKTFKL